MTAPRPSLPTPHRLLHATWSCVARSGFQATTAEVAAEVGCSPGTLFRHFPTRAALLEAALDRALHALRQDLPRAAPAELLHDALHRRWMAAGRNACLSPLAFRYWVLYAATPGLGSGAPEPLRWAPFGRPDRALGAALGTPALGTWALELLAATWAATVELTLARLDEAFRDEPEPDFDVAEELDRGFAAWWAGLGLARDTPVPAA